MSSSNSQKRDFFFDGGGRNGKNATSGPNGQHGAGYGSHGQAGGDAPSNNTPGQKGARIELELSTTSSDNNNIMDSLSSFIGQQPQPLVRLDVKVGSEQDAYHAPHSLQDQSLQLPLGQLGEVQFNVQGGKGGNGGIGGSGGNGSGGYHGRHATRFSSGANGGPGGDGGDGGRGSNGKDGGSAGTMTIKLSKQDDLYLLMAIQCLSPRSKSDPRVEGGQGGAPGAHGKPGQGGPGGRGGHGYHYTTSYQDSNGNRRSRSHYNPGGRSGYSGRAGRIPNARLERGKTGNPGGVEIMVEKSSGNPVTTAMFRYDLELKSYNTKCISELRIATTEMPCYEFGETLLVNECVVENIGQMPTPNQRAIIQLKQDQGNLILQDGHDCFYLPANEPMASGETKTLMHNDMTSHGVIRFTVAMPPMLTGASSIMDDFDAIRMKAKPVLEAIQLGVETREKTPRILPRDLSPFARSYDGFDKSSSQIQFAFPIESQSGLVGLHSLRHADTTTITLDIRNTSNQLLGRSSPSGRRVCVNFYQRTDGDYDLLPENLIVTDMEGADISIDPKSASQEYGHLFGHVVELDNLEPGSVSMIEHLVSFSSSTESLSKTAIQADIYLQAIGVHHSDGSVDDRPGLIQLIQRRKLEVHCQPTYECVKGAKAIIVTSVATEKDQLQHWMSMLESHKMPYEVCSVSAFGHLCPSQKVQTLEEPAYMGGSMREVEQNLASIFANRLVIVLNDEYKPSSQSARKICPASLIPSLDGFDASTRWLIVGGSLPKHLSHDAHVTIPFANVTGYDADRSNYLLAKYRVTAVRHESFSLFKKWMLGHLKNERAQAYDQSKERECHVISSSDPQMGKRLERFLSTDHSHTYIIEFRPTHKEYCVFRGHAQSRHCAVFVERGWDPSNSLERCGAIQSADMSFAFLSAASDETVMSCYAETLRTAADAEHGAGEKSPFLTCWQMRDLLVSKFCWEVAMFYHGRLVDPRRAEQALSCSPTLDGLASNAEIGRLIHDSTRDQSLAKFLRSQVSGLIALFESVSSAADLNRWWNPFSPKNHVRSTFTRAVKEFEELPAWNELIDRDLVRELKRQQSSPAKECVKRKCKGSSFTGINHRFRSAIRCLNSPINDEKFAGDKERYHMSADGKMKIFRLSEIRYDASAGQHRTSRNELERTCKIRKVHKPFVLKTEEVNKIRTEQQRRFDMITHNLTANRFDREKYWAKRSVPPMVEAEIIVDALEGKETVAVANMVKR